jgi:hypothetical protein
MIVRSVGLPVVWTSEWAPIAGGIARDFAHRENIDETAELLDELIDVLSVDVHRDAVHPRLLRAFDEELLNGEATSPE